MTKTGASEAPVLPRSRVQLAALGSIGGDKWFRKHSREVLTVTARAQPTAEVGGGIMWCPCPFDSSQSWELTRVSIYVAQYIHWHIAQTYSPSVRSNSNIRIREHKLIVGR